MKFFYGRIVIPFHSRSSKSRKSKMFTHSDFKIALSFAIIGSIAATALINNNLWMWRNWSTCKFIFWGSLFFITRLILVGIWSENLPRYGSTIIKSIFGTVLTTTFCVDTLSKNFLSTRSRGLLFLYKILLNIFISSLNFTKSEHKLKHRNNSDSIKPVL